MFNGSTVDTWLSMRKTRTARDLGFMPLVVGDARIARHEEDEMPALDRVDRLFAPVLSAAGVIGLIRRDRRAAA